MADNKKKIIEDLGKDVDLLQNKLNNLITTVGNNLSDSLRNKMQGLVDDSNNFIESFEKGENISKKISSKLTTVQKDLNNLSAKRLSLETELVKVANKKDKTRRNDILDQLLINKLATQQLESTQTYLYKLQQVTKQTENQRGVTGYLSDNWDKISDSLSKSARQLFVFKAILEAALNFNKISTSLGKNLGYSASQADRVTNNIVNAARGSENLNFTLKNAGEAANELNSALGGVAEYSADALETQIMLTKQFGLTGEEAAGIYKFSILSAKSSSQINDEMVGAFAATRNTVKGSADFKKTIAEVAKISGQLAANFKNNPAELTKAVVQAQVLGTTLAQTKEQGKQLLDFSTSIQNELEAELLTGQAINLERARAAALAGDQVTVMKELVNQGMTLNKFQNMNVIAQESFAKALGLTADQLADQLTKQKLAQEQGKSLAQITKEEALEAEKRQNIQDKFNAAMDKLKDIIGGLVAGPLGMMLSILSDALGLISSIVAGIQAVLGSGLTKVLLGTLTGAAVGGPIGALIGGLAGAASALIADDMVGYGARTLITPSGPVALNNSDTVIAGTNLFKGDDVVSYGKGSLKLGGSDNSDIIAAIKELGARPAVIDGARPFADVMGGQNELFTSGAKNRSVFA
jgi:hypothetical protein